MPDSSERAIAFGAVADDYDRFRPGPNQDVADWLLPAGATTAVDLGAGTGALTRLLVGRVDHVFSIEPDARMRQVLTARAPTATALAGTGDAIPLDDGIADAVLVSSAWHWMDVDPTLAEIARVLRPGGTLGVVWSGPDRRVRWFQQWLAKAREARGVFEAVSQETAAVVLDEALPGAGAEPDRGASAGDAPDGPRDRSAGGSFGRHRFELPAGTPFSEPEYADITWSVGMTVDDLVGLVGTYSVIIMLPPEVRREVLVTAKAWLETQPDLLAGGGTEIEVPFRALCWRTIRAD